MFSPWQFGQDLWTGEAAADVEARVGGGAATGVAIGAPHVSQKSSVAD